MKTKEKKQCWRLSSSSPSCSSWLWLYSIWLQPSWTCYSPSRDLLNYMHLMNLSNNFSYLIYQSYLCDMKYIWSILYSCDTIVWTALLIIIYYCLYLYKYAGFG
jgi:hypothetical protein